MFTGGLVPARFLGACGLGQALTVFTSMFLHGGLWHLLGNMIFLWFFGRLAEQRLGSRRFGWLYALAGVGAAASAVASVGASSWSSVTEPMITVG